MYRHGDVFLAATGAVPAGATKLPHLTLAEGEVTGHAHRIAERDAATLWKSGDELILEVTGPTATVTHEEHGPITLPQGTWRVWQQREYTPEEIRTVRD